MKQANPYTNNDKGFTLIELLVVITILAILAVVGFASFSGIQANARDARRREDIDALAKVIEVTKVAGSPTYATVAAANFAGGVFPADPSSSQAYEIALTTNPATPSTNWSASAGPSFSSTVTAGTASVATSGSTWKVCAWLETTSVAYCRSSAQ